MHSKSVLQSHSGKACLLKVCYKFSEKFASNFFFAIGDGFER